ncbi:glycosyltransferase [Microbacterium hominis]|uniref:D-inositol 3-phosphate glycosyltransferase n=1 Tax=Microbacterium hominis TaxID=162426 RepID=A0A7D4TFE7_9MICO|nr:glycosyltransferase [Microbacterium hominis]QKJ18561.1 glycosyltransferase [Microbacterium hominis]
MGVQTAMDRVLHAPTIVEALRAADDVAFEAGRDPGVRTLRVLAAGLTGSDDIAAIASVHALAEMHDAEAVSRLVALLSDTRPYIREHAAWALGQSLPRPEAIGRLLGLVAGGGFTGMLAQHTIEKWSGSAGVEIAVAIESALLGIMDAAPRAVLVETLGLVRQPIATRRLSELARDTTEPEAVREAAIAALGQRRGAAGVADDLEAILAGDGRLAAVARLALVDLEAVPPARMPGRGLTVAQLFLHADIDPSLSAAGAGDNGGIATLLVRLGDALSAPAAGQIERVVTLSRGSLAQSAEDLLQLAGSPSGHVYGHVPLGATPVASAAAWPLRVQARRGIRRALTAAGGVDVLHLRMADVGSLAAADVARELGIPTVFTVAPDPHSVISSLEGAGSLTRGDFGAADLRDHFWFRARLVQALAASASHTVLFPRPNLAQDMRELVGIDIESRSERHTVVAEGVDLAVIDDAVHDARRAASTPRAQLSGAIGELARLLEDLAPERRGLPLLVTVGRMHRVKGMATLVDAWASSPLRDRANLLVIGGDLDTPSVDERAQLDLIDRVVPAGERKERGLILAGHRPNDVAARWIAAARFGMPGLAAPDGAYVCASIKEEFGLAVLEALATGLVVVAPDGGGPATYVADGDTGFLTATWDRDRLAAATAGALDRAADGDAVRPERARAMVAARFTIQAMAATLAPVYGSVVAQEAELLRAARMPA